MILRIYLIHVTALSIGVIQPGKSVVYPLERLSSVWLGKEWCYSDLLRQRSKSYYQTTWQIQRSNEKQP
jgi:hypothetical protein